MKEKCEKKIVSLNGNIFKVLYNVYPYTSLNVVKLRSLKLN